ncbi:MAG: hypothetical protein Q8J64_06850 [Thermodesulfovibrionales bacterium]|nr:hypothetical protein [Thermodesulfovibrionales bacterium]
MLTLMWNFYNEAIVYDPLGEIEKVEQASEDGSAKTLPSFKSAWGREISDKNLFSPARGSYVPPPPLPVAVPKAEDPKQRPVFGLRGIIRNQFGEYVALIEKDNARPVPLRKGDRLEDVLVVNLDERTATLLWNGEEIRLNLSKIRKLKR